MELSLRPEVFSVCRLGPDDALPDWFAPSRLYSIVRSEDELSLVCEERLVPDGVRSEGGWRALVVEGTLDFSLTGILASLVNPLAERGISVFAFSSFDTDYVMVKEASLEATLNALRSRSIKITPSNP